VIIVTTLIRSLIIVVCLAGSICSIKLYKKLDKSVYKTMAALFILGFAIVAIGKIIAIVGSYFTALSTLASMHEIVGALGLAFLLIGLISVLINAVVTTNKLDDKIIRRMLNADD